MPREMKDSGIEWIGEIPSTWDLSKIGTLYAERKTKVSDVDYPPLSVTMKGIVPQLATAAKTDAHDDRKLVCVGDFAINSRSDRRGSCGISDYDGSVSLINTILTPRNSMNPRYYNWLFHTASFADEFYSWGHGIVDDLWTTNWQDMKRIQIPIPPLAEQQAIADFLDTKCAEIDAVIEKTKATIEEYKALKQSVITEAVTKGIRGDRPMKDSGIEWIGDIPSEWESVKLKYCTYIRARLGWKGLKADEYVDEGYPLLSAFNIINNKLDFSDVNYINQFRYDESPEIKLSIDDILLVKDGAGIGKCAIVEELPIPSTPNGSLAVVTITNHLYPKFLYYYFLSKMFQKYIDRIKDGMGVPHLFQSDLREIEIVISSLDEQKEIVSYLDQKCSEIDRLIEKKTQLLEEMETFKKSLIFDYVTGKKEVV